MTKVKKVNTVPKVRSNCGGDWKGKSTERYVPILFGDNALHTKNISGHLSIRKLEFHNQQIELTLITISTAFSKYFISEGRWVGGGPQMQHIFLGSSQFPVTRFCLRLSVFSAIEIHLQTFFTKSLLHEQLAVNVLCFVFFSALFLEAIEPHSCSCSTQLRHINSSVRFRLDTPSKKRNRGSGELNTLTSCVVLLYIV